MSNFKIGDRVKVISVPNEDDNDLLGLEGVIPEQDSAEAFASALFGWIPVHLDNQPKRFADSGTPWNFFFPEELELV